MKVLSRHKVVTSEAIVYCSCTACKRLNCRVYHHRHHRQQQQQQHKRAHEPQEPRENHSHQPRQAETKITRKKKTCESVYRRFPSPNVK